MIGWTVSGTAENQGQVWWSFFNAGPQTEFQRDSLKKLFFDICGVKHPNEEIPSMKALWNDSEAGAFGAGDSGEVDPDMEVSDESEQF